MDLRQAQSMGLSTARQIEAIDIFGLTVGQVDDMYEEIEAREKRRGRAGFTGMT